MMQRVFLTVFFGCCFAISPANAGSNARVEYVNPDNFTDVSFRSMTRQDAEHRLEHELTATIEKAAAQYLSGYEVAVRIMDVAMAGREAFEQPGFNADLRIRNSMGKPPKISVQYEVKDPAGRSVAKGAQVLTNLTYQWDYPDTNIDTLYPEKQLVRDWIRGLRHEISRR